MKIDLADVLGGMVFIGIGATAVIMSSAYGLGTPTNMGAGYFPFVLGLLSIALGVAIAAPAFLRAGAIPNVAWRPLIAVIVAISAFALCANLLGYLPGVAIATVIAALGDKKNSPFGIVILSACVTLGVWLVFTVGLHVTPQAFKGI